MTLRRALLLVLLAVTTACMPASAGSPSSHGPGGPAPQRTSAEQLSGTLTIFAAASLTDSFTAITAAFAAVAPDVELLLNLAGSQQLAGQLLAGAPADVLATADLTQMAAVAGADLLRGAPQVFAANTLVIAVEPGNPLGIASLSDLSDDDVVLVMPAPAVPAGRYAARALADARVEVSPASLELDVRAALSRVALGEADAGIVYRTDVVAAGGRVDGVPLDTSDVLATYPIAMLAEAANPRAADAFIDFVAGPQGQRILREHGFQPAP